MSNLEGKVVLVTGASRGIGQAIALSLGKAGATVIGTATSGNGADAISATLKDNGVSGVGMALNVTDNDQIAEVMKSITESYGSVDILINNAGIPDAQWAIKQSDELIDNVIDTNLTGPYFLSCEVARRLIDQGIPGRMVNISSMAGFSTSPNSAAVLYSTTKLAIVRMTESLAVEWARHNINVNAIAPGCFSSEMLDGMLERIGDISQSFPRKRICQPEQMDSTLLFLVSPSSECVTGTCIKIDDGQGSR